MSEIEQVFNEVNSIRNSSEIDIVDIPNRVRRLFERALKEKLGIPRQERKVLGELLCIYNDKFPAIDVEYEGKSFHGIRYMAVSLRDYLNDFSHDTLENPTSKDIIFYLQKFNFILEVLFEKKNNLFKNLNDIEIEEVIFNKLNKEQKQALKSNERLILVNAGPGTGKTHLITHRILEASNKVENKRIVGLSFTNQAANSLKSKLDNLIFGTDYIEIKERVFIGTIHSFALDCIKSYNLNILKEEFTYSIIDEIEYKEIFLEFYNNKENVAAYLFEHRLLTFDEIINLFRKKLIDDLNFKNYLTNEIQEIIIDEAQDVDKLQYDIFLELFNNSKSLNFFLVGDQRQNIFDFRGGNLGNFLKTFNKDNITEFNLVESYRCPDSVLQYVNTFKFNDCTNVPLSNTRNIGEIPILAEFNNKAEESAKIAEIINQYLLNNYSLNDMVVLSPISFYFEDLAKSLNKHHIPFKIFGGESILDPKIRFLINLLKSIILKNNYSLIKAITYWNSKIKISTSKFDKTIDEVTNNTEYAINKSINLTVNFINEYVGKTSDPVYLTLKFLEFTKGNLAFHNFYDETVLSFYQVIKEINIDNVDKLSIIITSTNDHFHKFFKRSTDIKCATPILDDYLTLSTIHSAKGKEWDYVFIPGLTQDIFPGYNSDNNAELKKFYVACTRTKKRLYFFRPMSYMVLTKYGSYYTFNGKDVSVFFRNAIPQHVLLEDES